jgi:hypothetical protein
MCYQRFKKTDSFGNNVSYTLRLFRISAPSKVWLPIANLNGRTGEQNAPSKVWLPIASLNGRTGEQNACISPCPPEQRIDPKNWFD